MYRLKISCRRRCVWSPIKEIPSANHSSASAFVHQAALKYGRYCLPSLSGVGSCIFSLFAYKTKKKLFMIIAFIACGVRISKYEVLYFSILPGQNLPGQNLIGEC